MDIYPLGTLTDISNHSIDLPPPSPLPSPSQMTNIISAETYIYADENNLMPELWSYDDFVKNNAHKWHGITANGDPASAITEADRRGNK